ncbi:GAP family protein [Microbacterium sp. AZCO]|uniref:GAP family protein n=1 Tax=Microbacterium sp. AZCO TaxID=3142976 RepID=UPI0031F358BC
MNGATVSLALGVAASPVPIIAVLALLLGRRARTAGVALLVGWAASIAIVVSVVTLIADRLPADALQGPRPVQGVIQLVLAASAVVLAIVSWVRQPRRGAAPRLPAWIKAVDSMSFPVACLAGVVLIPLSPKNLLLTASAGIELGAAELSPTETVIAIAVFTIVATSTVLIPVAAYLIAGTRLHRLLEVLRLWLIRRNSVITTILLLLLAVWLAANGIAIL